MKQVFSKTTIDKLPLSQCQPGDRIYIKYKPYTGGFWGNVDLVKIKSLTKGDVQIKYRNCTNGKIHKCNLLGSTIVERSCKIHDAQLEQVVIPNHSNSSAADAIYTKILSYHSLDPTSGMRTVFKITSPAPDLMTFEYIGKFLYD